MQSTEETWAFIPNLENYEASDLGRIRSIDRYIKGKSGSAVWRPGHILKHANSIAIYNQHYLWDELVLSAFGVQFNWLIHEIIYKNEDPNDCSVNNLEVKLLKDPNVEWRDVNGWEGIYQVSAKGEVVRLPIILKHPRGFNIRIRGQHMKLHPDADGYLRVGLTGQGKHTETRGVHQLVAKAYINCPQDNLVINHIDGNKQNNNVSNLEWCTVQENTQHAVKLGLITKECWQKGGYAAKALYAKRCRCIQTGQEFDSMRDAERDLKLYPSAVIDSIKRGAKVGPNKLTFELIS